MNMSNSIVLPWYRYPMVWMLIAIPFSAVIMGVIMIWLAITTDDGLVADDYYKQGIAINRNLSRDVLAQEKGLGAVLEMDNTDGLVRINLALDKGGIDSYPDSVQLKLQYATHDHNDVHLVLNHGQGDRYIGMVKRSLMPGKWYIELSQDDWRLNGSMDVSKQVKVQLAP
ncbi:MAG: FixH family protein [Gammaproteobacteria bacterium]|nr:FixH family protein [Gammaproteobacteria bacterium]